MTSNRPFLLCFGSLGACVVAMGSSLACRPSAPEGVLFSAPLSGAVQRHLGATGPASTLSTNERPPPMDGEPSLLGVEPQLISAPSRAPQQTSAAAVFRELKTAFETHETAVIAILVGHAQPDGTLNEVKWAATERDFFEDTRSSWWARIFAQADLQRLTTSDDGNSASLPVVMGGAFETWELHFTKASDGRWYLLKHAP